MKKGLPAFLILIIVAIAIFSSSWLIPKEGESIPKIETVQPIFALGEKEFDLSRSTRPWIAPNDLRQSLTVTPEPNAIEISYWFKGKETWHALVENGETLLLPKNDGITRISINVFYSNQKQPLNKQLFVANHRPVEVQLNQTSFLPGQLAILHLDYLDPGQQVLISGDWFTLEPEWFRSGNEGLVLYPIPSSTDPGSYSLLIEPENEPPIQLSLTIQDREFVMQPLTVDPKVNAATRNDNSYEEFHKMLVDSRNVTESIPLFETAFIMPLDGRMTTEYGQGRTINGVPSGSRHSGYDLAAPTGTEFMAAQTGKVRFAAELTLTGNTVILEHGLGIFSQYYHMDRIQVSAGELVEQGQILGTVGSTGFSTGPHLHYCVYVNGAYVDPAVFMNESFANSIQLLPQ